MSREEYYKAGYTIALISEFAARYGLVQRQAYLYLKRFRGLDHFFKHYNIMHTLSFADSVETVYQVCKNNGGKLQ